MAVPTRVIQLPRYTSCKLFCYIAGQLGNRLDVMCNQDSPRLWISNQLLRPCMKLSHDRQDETTARCREVLTSWTTATFACIIEISSSSQAAMQACEDRALVFQTDLLVMLTAIKMARRSSYTVDTVANLDVPRPQTDLLASKSLHALPLPNPP